MLVGVTKDQGIRNVLFLYNPLFINILALRNHVEAFGKYSKHRIDYMPAGAGLDCNFVIDQYDAIVIHYSLRVCFTESHGTLSAAFENTIAKLNKPKFLFIQDEYDNTNIAIDKMNKLGITTVFTCVPDEYIEKIYPASKLPKTKFVSVLTGYVPESFCADMGAYAKPLEQRSNWLVYRGRELPYVYGALGREKYEIGIKMRSFANQNSIPHDIEVDDRNRIYGDAWYEFIGNGRAMLATESGSNVFDFDGTLKESIKSMRSKNKNITYEEVYSKLIGLHDHFIRMNQVSPKIFEAITLRTALVLFEGEYSGVVKPNEHYIVLKKDYSNVEEVFKKLEDLDYLKQMTDRAYKDVIESHRYSYRVLIRLFDENISVSCLKAHLTTPVPISFTPEKILDPRVFQEGYLSLAFAPSSQFKDILRTGVLVFKLSLPRRVINQIALIFVRTWIGSRCLVYVKVQHPDFFSTVKTFLLKKTPLKMSDKHKFKTVCDFCKMKSKFEAAD